MKNETPNVIAIILNYNNYLDTIECIHSLLNCTYPKLKIIIVDNGSTDDSERKIQNIFPWIEIIQTGSNLGFAEGNNIGIRHALSDNPEYILILNNDTLVEPSFLSPLIDALNKNSDAGVACGTICLFPEKEKIWYAGGRFIKWRASGFSYGTNIYDSSIKTESTSIVTFIPGCMMLIHTRILEKVGLFNDSFFMYVEDVEFSARVHNNGFNLLYVPKSRIYHKVKHRNTNPFQLYYNVRNRFLLISLTIKGLCKCTAYFYLVFTISFKSIIYMFLNPKMIYASWLGVIDFIKGNLYSGNGMLFKEN